MEANKNMKTLVSKVEPYLPGFNSSLPSYPLYSFSLRGRGKLPFLSVNKNIIDLGDVYLGQKVEDNFSVFCEQSGFVGFKITKIFQQILTEKDGENYVNNFFKNPCLENSIVFKDKLPMNNNLGEEEPIQGLFTENENRNDLKTKDVDYIEIFTNKNNFVDKKQENNNNIDTNNNDVKEKIIEDKNINDIKKQKSNTNNTTKTTLNRKTKTKNKSFKEEEPQKKEIEKQKVNINDKLVITIGKELPFNIQFTPDTLGRFKASIVFQLEDGISFDIDILANVIGPELAINTPLIDFGLFASGTIQKREIEIENLSPIKAQYLIREARYNNINFDNFQTNGYIEEFEGVLDESKDIKYRDKVKSLIEYDNTNMKNLDIMKLDCYSMKFSSVYG